MLTFIKHRISRRKNKDFVEWFVYNKKNPNSEAHHLLGSDLGGKKCTDWLLVNVTSEMHKRIHYAKHSISPELENEFLVQAIENLIDYAEYLQRELAGKRAPDTFRGKK